MKQGSEEWRQARCGMVTASRFSDVLAKIKTGEAAVRRNYRAELVVERLTGVPGDSFESQAMREGTQREPDARFAYEAATGSLVIEVGFLTRSDPVCGASPDGLIDTVGGLEIKCPTRGTHFEYLRLKAGECPPEYKAQVQGGMWLADRLWWDWISFNPEFPPELQLIRRRIVRDQIYIDGMALAIEAFEKEVAADVEFARGYKEPAHATFVLD